MTDMSPRPLSKLLEPSQFAFLDICFLLSTCLGVCFLSFFLRLSEFDGAYIPTSFVLYLHCPFNWQWQTWVTSLYYQPGFYKKIYSCFTLLVHHVISFVWEWDELDNLQLQEFFGGGTFLEARVTYGGVDSGAICKEPVQAMVSHHHPQSSSWKLTLKYGKRSFVAFVTTYGAESDRSLR